MSENLDLLINIARRYRGEHAFSPEEKDRQVRSFAYGNTHIENNRITKQDIDQAADSLRAESVEPIRS